MWHTVHVFALVVSGLSSIQCCCCFVALPRGDTLLKWRQTQQLEISSSCDVYDEDGDDDDDDDSGGGDDTAT